MLTDFELLDRALSLYKQTMTKNIITNDECKRMDDECEHLETIIQSGMVVCLECGIEIMSELLCTKNWSNNMASYTADINQCQPRKVETKSIHKDLVNLGISEHVINKANELFQKITKGATSRGKARKAKIFACLFHAYVLTDNPQSYETLFNIFNIDRKIGLDGLKKFSKQIPKEFLTKTKGITVSGMINKIMGIFNGTDTQRTQVYNIFKKVRKKSSTIIRSRPQSVAAGVVYYWITKTNREIDIDEYSSKVGLSISTIENIVSEIETIIT
jgi:hypothetical protein